MKTFNCCWWQSILNEKNIKGWSWNWMELEQGVRVLCFSISMHYVKLVFWPCGTFEFYGNGKQRWNQRLHNIWLRGCSLVSVWKEARIKVSGKRKRRDGWWSQGVSQEDGIRRSNPSIKIHEIHTIKRQLAVPLLRILAVAPIILRHGDREEARDHLFATKGRPSWLRLRLQLTD